MVRECKRCGHSWFARIEAKSKQCPRCKSPNWDKEAIRLLSTPEILRLELIADCKSGVYFLIKGESVVYVGASSAVSNRIKSHLALNKIDFDRYVIIPVDKNLLLQVEKDYIRHIIPTYNQHHAPGQSTTGGKRTGAGRKKETPTILFPVRVTEHTREALKVLAKAKKIAVGEMLTRLALDREYREAFDN